MAPLDNTRLAPTARRQSSSGFPYLGYWVSFCSPHGLVPTWCSPNLASLRRCPRRRCVLGRSSARMLERYGRRMADPSRVFRWAHRRGKWLWILCCLHCQNRCLKIVNSNELFQKFVKRPVHSEKSCPNLYIFGKFIKNGAFFVFTASSESL